MTAAKAVRGSTMRRKNATTTTMTMMTRRRGTMRAVGAEAKRAGRRAVAVRAAKEFTCEVEKPLGMKLGQKPGEGGGVKVDFVNPGGNASKAGIKAGDTILYTSSWFGEELWPADKLAFVMTSINARKGDVAFVVVRGDKPGEYDVKRLNSRPAPKRFGRKLTEAQKARATHICIDCGYVYTLPTTFDDQPSSYLCPQCAAPKKRFARYDAEKEEMIGGGTPIVAIASFVVAAVAIGGLTILAQ